MPIIIFHNNIIEKNKNKMISLRGNKFNEINFNLKIEIFSFFQAKNIIEFIPVSKAFKTAIENMKWLKIIKEKYIQLISDSKLMFSEMNEVNKLFITEGESEISSFYICLYLSLKKIKNESLINIGNLNFFFIKKFRIS